MNKLLININNPCKGWQNPRTYFSIYLNFLTDRLAENTFKETLLFEAQVQKLIVVNCLGYVFKEIGPG